MDASLFSFHLKFSINMRFPACALRRGEAKNWHEGESRNMSAKFITLELNGLSYR